MSSRMLADRAIPALWLAILFTGCGQGKPREASQPAAPIPVATLEVGTELANILILPGRARASEEVTLTARGSGRVTRFLALEGEAVHAGQVIVRFGGPETEGALQAARSERAAAVIALEVSARQQARIESLFVARVVAQSDQEAAVSQRRGAEARLAEAEARLASAAATSEIRAPFNGVVVRRHVDSGADVMLGTALVDVRSNGRAELIANVPEAALAALPGARFAFQTADNAWREARLLRIDGMTDVATRTRLAHFAPTEPVSLDPGGFVRVRITSSSAAIVSPRTTSVPLSCIVRRGALTGVFLVEASHASLRWVRLGRVEGTRVEILSGIEPGEVIIASPVGLTDGAAVKVHP